MTDFLESYRRVEAVPRLPANPTIQQYLTNCETHLMAEVVPAGGAKKKENEKNEEEKEVQNGKEIQKGKEKKKK